MVAFDSQITVRRTRYASEETGWAVIEAADADGAPLVLVGPLSHLEERERAHVVGTWVEDRRYGPQVKVSAATPLPPTDAATLTAYLVRVRRVGPRRAARLIDLYGTSGVLDAVDADPQAAFAAAGLGRAAAAEAAHSWERMRVTRRLHLMLAPHGLAYLVPRIHEALGDRAHREVSARPYELTSVFGVGFAIADQIARGLGRPIDPRERARAGVLHLLSEAERGGSTCLPLEGLLASLRELLGHLPGAPLLELPGELPGAPLLELPGELPGAPAGAGLIDTLSASRDVVRDGRWVYRRQTAELEAELAGRVNGLLCAPGSGRLRPRQAPDPPGTANDGDGLTGEQRTAVANALTHRLSLVTGGPGTGKTASIRAMATLGRARGARVLLAAPTGRAAIRMTEAAGVRAKTVHAALGWIPGEGPTHDADDPLPCDLLIVDETSMANLELLVTLLRAVGATTHVVLVGDADQLAPVGAGKPFAEVIASGIVPTTRLTHIFRQAAGSMIVQGAHAIRRGKLPSFTLADGMRRDLFLIERADPIRARAEIVSLVAERLPAHYRLDPVTDIQVFAPVYRGELGIDALNQALRDALNPDGRPLRGGRLRLGDKLMMTGRNLHELGLMNGTLLRMLDEVEGSSEDDGALILGAEEGAIFRLAPEEAERLKLAYACSVHRGQGIELPVAVIVAHPAAGAFFLRREMLYTAVTRARMATVIVGTRDVLARAVRTPDTGRRHSRVADRLVAARG
ncbi:MAG: AAA family ATPase [Solirubrobacterales bacterium]|nr:AAA family ATPase [Solirubrobacterales bacterium]